MAARRARRARAATRAPSGNLLRSRALARALVVDAGIEPEDLVVEIGAGTGRLTAELVARARQVLAFEPDPERAAGLRRRFAATANLAVLEADAATAPLPREPFKVVANLPFDRTTDLLRRLLGDPQTPLVSADVVVQWEVACKRAAVWPSTMLGVHWGAWWELSVRRRLDRSAFDPPPAVDAAVLRASRREQPLVAQGDRARYAAFLRDAFGRGGSPPGLHRLAAELGASRRAAARDLDAVQWARLFELVRGPR